MNLMDIVICRTPAFSRNDSLEENWDNLKDLIKEASPEFFEVIRHMDHQALIKADSKVRFTVWKYMNRARHRPTPFGRFGAIGLLPVSRSKGEAVIEIHMHIRQFIDWKQKDALKSGIMCDHLIANSTWYLAGAEIRYVKFINDRFELAVVNAFTELEAALIFCRKAKGKEALAEHLFAQFGLAAQGSSYLIDQMVEQQILLTERMANITGADYFSRLNTVQEKNDYIIAERRVRSGGIHPAPFELLPEYLHFIKTFIPQQDADTLNKFRDDFSRKFDCAAIPLSCALDPETGVGYGAFANEPEDADVGDILLDLSVTAQPGNSFQCNSQSVFLLKQLLKGEIIRLEEYMDASRHNDYALPNTISVICSLHNGMPVVESAGGCTANALLGRFTLENPEILGLCHDISQIESDANPGVEFFDVAYQAEKNVDNVNRRGHCYRKELPLLSWSCLDQPLTMQDIWVLVRNKEIILWSKELKRRIVPRIASAYNYGRSDLPVYRFLCDLQQQHLSTDLSFQFDQFLPGLDHYPRVMYKNMIIAPATWKLDKMVIDVAGLKSWLKQKKIEGPFKTGIGDQTLCFDPACDEDLNAFISYTTRYKRQEIPIYEALTNDGIQNDRGKKYHAQLILNYAHDKCLYQPFELSKGLAGADPRYPGSDWLYFEIYSHPVRAGSILLCIDNYVREEHGIKKWFFIRYENPLPHIRLRLQLHEKLTAGKYLAGIKNLLEPFCDGGLVSDIQVRTYFRESGRYGPGRMGVVEQAFCEDSKLILNLLVKFRRTSCLQMHALKFIAALFELAELPDKIDLLKKVTDSFTVEFQMKGEVFKKINTSFKSAAPDLPLTNFTLPDSYKKIIVDLFKLCDPGEKELMVTDLIHMHINRLFPVKQRMHEAIIYQYALKLALAENHRQAREPVF